MPGIALSVQTTGLDTLQKGLQLLNDAGDGRASMEDMGLFLLRWGMEPLVK